MFDGDLSKLSLASFPFSYSKSVSREFSYPNGGTNIDFVRNQLLKIPLFRDAPHPLDTGDLSWCGGFLTTLLRQSDLTFARHAAKVLPHLFCECKPDSRVLAAFITMFDTLRDQFPGAKFLVKPYAIALICQKLGDMRFFRRHLLSIDKAVAACVVDVLQGDLTPASKGFILSVLVPSLQKSEQPSVSPRDAVLLPDPIHMLKYLSEFSDLELQYACHVLQICHRYLLGIVKLETEPTFSNVALFLGLSGKSFRKSCLSRALLIAMRVPETADVLTKLVHIVDRLKCPPILESFFLFNTSFSFRMMIPFIGNSTMNYFMSHLRDLGGEMRYLVSAYNFDMQVAAEHLATFDLSQGNQIYLYWMYVFFCRLADSPASDRVQVINDYVSSLASHLKLLYNLILSAENMTDPLIDRLLCSAISVIMRVLRDVTSGFDSEPLVMGSQVFDIVIVSLHFLVSTQTFPRPCSISVDLLECYQEISLLLHQSTRFFERAASSPMNPVFLPMYALAFAHLRVDPALTRPLIADLILSDDPVVFNCLAHMAEKQASSRDFIASVMDVFWDILFVPQPIDSATHLRILVRCCLLFVVIFSSDAISKDVDPESFGPFYDSVNDHIIQRSIKEQCIPLQEAAIFLLGSFYSANFRSYSGDHFILSPFFDRILTYSPEAASSLLTAFVSQARYFGGLPFEVNWEDVSDCRASNLTWFSAAVTGNLSGYSPPAPPGEFSLPWRQRRPFSPLLSASTWAVQLTPVSSRLVLKK